MYKLRYRIAGDSPSKNGTAARVVRNSPKNVEHTINNTAFIVRHAYTSSNMGGGMAGGGKRRQLVTVGGRRAAVTVCRLRAVSSSFSSPPPPPSARIITKTIRACGGDGGGVGGRARASQCMQACVCVCWCTGRCVRVCVGVQDFACVCVCVYIRVCAWMTFVCVSTCARALRRDLARANATPCFPRRRRRRESILSPRGYPNPTLSTARRVCV